MEVVQLHISLRVCAYLLECQLSLFKCTEMGFINIIIGLLLK